MLRNFYFWIMYQVADVHDWILAKNISLGYLFTDEFFHFLLIGLLGVILYLMIRPLFRFLFRHGQEWLVSWLYTFALVGVIAMGIEIGQQVTNTGHLELEDISYSFAGFLAFSAVYAVICAVVWAVKKLVRYLRRK